MVVNGAQKSNLYGEFERISEWVEEQTFAERAYLKLDDDLTGNDLRRRVEESAVEDAVESRFEKLRQDMEKTEETEETA